MKFSRGVKSNLSPIYGILAIIFPLCLLAIAMGEWPTKMRNELPQWWNQNLETFRRELVETQSDHQQQILEQSKEKLGNVQQDKTKKED